MNNKDNKENDTIKTTDNENNVRKKPKKKKGWSKKKKALLIIIIIVAMLLMLAGVLVGMAFHYINKLNIVPETDSYEILDSIEPDDDITSKPDSPKEDIDKLEDDIRRNLEENATEIISDDNVLNILLIGTDSRTATGRGRSDSMILVSINKNTKKIIMTSFLRDIYLSIPNVESTRLNHAYAYGGPDLLIDTIEQNFKVRIDKYAQVNFYSFITVVDALGGVDINVTDEEVQYVNMYMREINRLEGFDENDSTLSSGGNYTLNGRQALAYSRIRYIGTDFQRTERQRTVLEKLMNKMKSASLSELNDLADVLLPNITTNLQKGEVFSLILNSPTYLSYDTVQCRVPDDNTWWNLTIRGMSVLGVDFDENISYLRKNIYGK